MKPKINEIRKILLDRIDLVEDEKGEIVGIDMLTIEHCSVQLQDYFNSLQKKYKKYDTTN